MKTLVRIILGREKLKLDIRIANAIIESRLNFLKAPANAYLKKKKKAQNNKTKAVELNKDNVNQQKESTEKKQKSFLSCAFFYRQNIQLNTENIYNVDTTLFQGIPVLKALY